MFGLGTLVLFLGIGWGAWAFVSSHYQSQVVLSGILSRTAQPFRVVSQDSCVGVLTTSYAVTDNNGSSDQTFEGGGSIRLRWQGRDVVVGGAYHLEANMVNQLSVVETQLSGLGYVLRASVVGTDRYRGAATIFMGEDQVQSVPIDVPGPLSVSERAGGRFDVVAPLRTFRQSHPIALSNLIRLEPGTCDPNGALDLAAVAKQISGTLPTDKLPFSPALPQSEEP